MGIMGMAVDVETDGEMEKNEKAIATGMGY